jgi:hypothetical protein
VTVLLIAIENLGKFINLVDSNWHSPHLQVDIWRKQNDGKIDLITATVTTTAAFDLFQQTELDLYTKYRSYFSIGRSNEDLSLTIFYAESFRQGEDPEEYLRSPKALKVTAFDEFIFLPTARVLLKYARISAMGGEKAAWPLPIVPMRFSYIIDPELLQTPQMQKYEREDELLTQLLLDIAVLDELKNELVGMDDMPIQSGAMPAVDDILSKYLRPLLKGEVTAVSVFAARLWLDIIALHGALPDFDKTLSREANQTQNTLGFHVDSSNALDTPPGIRWLSKDNDLLSSIYGLLQQIEQPRFPMFKEMMLENNPETVGIDVDDPNVDPVLKQALEERLREKYPDWTPPEQKHVENAKRLNLRSIRPK